MACADKMATVYLGLGSNLEPRKENLHFAREHLPEVGVRIVAESRIYRTAPWGVTDQPDFLNQVVRAETELSPTRLVAELKRLEKLAGRVKTVFWGPRVLDIDILLYEELTFAAKGLTIPHREICNRAFVLIPLLDVAPDLVLPGGMRAAAALARLPEAERNGVVLYHE